MSVVGSALYPGRVTHRRLRPVAHRLEYKVFSLLIDVDEIGALDRRLKRFSYNRFNLYSIYDRDFGARDGRPIANYVRGVLRAADLSADGRIRALCYPRILGYVFNPLTVYFCEDRAGRLAAILYEVSNTFGGRHSYLIPVEGDADPVRQSAAKRFHVSPFMEMDMRYHFRISPPAATVAVAIRQTDAEGPVLNAAFLGERRTLSDAELMRCFRAYPLMTLKVIAGIHWEAARLIAKGLKLRKGARAPDGPVTVVRTRPAPRAA